MGKIIERVRQRQQQAERAEARRRFDRYEISDGFICRWGADGRKEIVHDLVSREPVKMQLPHNGIPWWRCIW